ncbi:MAG TPA: ferredoxin-thioredoxin reductase catalytic domain-containing protein [bacterium]
MFEHDNDCQMNYQRLKKIAERKGFIINPNRDWDEQIIGLMTNNLKEHGKYYCPCKQHHPVDRECDVVCPCPTLDDEVEQDGYCHCRLFCKKDYKREIFNILETITCPG